MIYFQLLNKCCIFFTRPLKHTWQKEEGSSLGVALLEDYESELKVQR